MRQSLRQTRMGTALTVTLLLLAFSLTAAASSQIPGRVQEHPIALVGGTIHPISGAVIERGTVLFENGKITAVGQEVALPTGTERINVRGKHVYPGFIDANTVLGLVEVFSIRGSVDLRETGAINPNIRAEVAINPDSELIPVARRHGVTLALSVPQGGRISGTSALLMLDGWTPEDMTLKAPVGLHLQWPEMETLPATLEKDEREKRKKERAEQQKQLREAFRDARAYLKAKEAEAGRGAAYHDVDVRWEAMIPVLKGEVPVFVHADEVKQIQAAVDFLKAEQLDMVLVGGQDAWRVPELLKENDIPVLAGRIHSLPMRRGDPYDGPFALPARLHEAGVRFCIAGPERFGNECNLPYEAARAVAHGLPREEALRAITLYPAQILGVSDRVGSLEVGKDATLFVVDGDPLETTSQVEREYIQGREVDLDSKHEILFRKYQEKYRRLGYNVD